MRNKPRLRSSRRSRWLPHRVIALLGVLFVAVPAIGQTYISTATQCEGTISRRSDTGSRRVHYLKTGPADGFFVAGSSLTIGNNIHYPRYLLNGYNVNDFTFCNDTVYFCGEDTAGIGFYGWISAQNMGIEIIWTYHFYRLYDDDDTYVTDVRHIEAFRSGGSLNVLLIGTYNHNGVLSKKSLIHVKDNSACTLAWGSVDAFDEVVVLDDYVVTANRKASRDNGHYAQYMRVLSKTPFTLYDSLFDYYSNWAERTTEGFVSAQGVGGNRLATAFYSDTAYYVNTFTVDSGILALHNCYTVATSAMPSIGDMAYNGSDSTLVILHNIDTVGTALFFDCSAFPVLSISRSEYPSLSFIGAPTLLSAAKRSSDSYIVTGIMNGHPFSWNTQSCGIQRQNTITGIETGISRALGATQRTTIGIQYNTSNENPEYFSVVPQCPGFIFGDDAETGKQ